MPTYDITAPNGKQLSVTGDHTPTESELKDIFKAAGVETGSAPASQPSPSTDAALGLQMLSKAVPGAASAALAVANSPSVPAMGARIGKLAGPGIGASIAGSAGAIAGAETGAPLGRMIGQGVQAVAGPVSRAATAVAPYAQALSTLSGAQGVADLAQMAEPNRKDIGFMGLGASSNPTVDPGMITANTQAHQDRWAREAADRQERVMKWAEKMPASVRASFLALMGGR